MTFPGPTVLGRGLVLPTSEPVPPAWADAPRLVIDAATLAHQDRLDDLLHRLQLAWVQRQPTVVGWDLAALPDDVQHTGPIWQLDPGFLFPMERLRFLLFTNNYDAREGEPVWWWTHKAERALGVGPGSAADVVLPDGRQAWIDGGPRQTLPALSHPVISGESIDLGAAVPVPPPTDPAPDGLASDQVAAIAHPAGPARVVAPAGSGKTRTLAARLRHLLDDRAVEPAACVTLAYNAKAAEELRTRLGVDRSLVRTIHSVGWAILQEAHGPLDLIDEREVRGRLSRFVSVPRRANSDPLAPYLESLDLVRAGLGDPERVESMRDDVAGFADAFERYRADLYARRRVDHGEQVYGAIEALVRDPKLRRRWQDRSRHLLVDEFQDLTPAYLLLIRLLASPRLQVFGVGDDDQVIYGYAGADPSFLIDFDEYFPGAGHLALHTNYRCPEPVVSAATNLLSYNRRRIDKTIHAAPDAVGDDDALLVEQIPGEDLATRAAGLVQEWLADGTAPSDIAVLARVNSTLIPAKAALADLSIPTDDLLESGLLQRTGLRALFAWLRVGLDPDAIRRDDLLEVVRRPGRGLTTIAREIVTRSTLSLDDVAALSDRLDEKRARKWREFTADLRAVADRAGTNDAAAVIDLIIDDIGLGTSARALDAGRGNAARSSHFDELTAVRRATALHPRLDDLRSWLVETLDRPGASGGVTLSSVHRVKGMEWKRVIVFGADRGAMPHDLAEDIEEERRVLHVAITRSIEQTVVLASRSRPSRFLRELTGEAPRAVADAAQPSTPGPWFGPSVGDAVQVRGGYTGRVTGTNGRKVLVRIDTGAILNVEIDDVQSTEASDERSPADPELADALRRWRRDTSGRLGVPAFVVFDDKTMFAIAAAKPRDETALIAVRGIGPAKLEAYGDEILSIVEEFAGSG